MDWIFVEEGDYYSNSNWIEEEECLINWAENLDFTKRPLNNIATTFIYIDSERCITGILRTNISLELPDLDMSSLLNKSVFFDKVNDAKTPSVLFTDKKDIPWVTKSYEFDDAAIFTVVNDDRNDYINKTNPFVPIIFSKNTMTIPKSISILHNLYEIVVIMRVVPVVDIKSILRVGSKIGKTKKVHISDELPAKYVYVKNHPVSGKRKTRRIR